MKRLITHIHVRAINLSSQRGILRVGHLAIPCSLGRGGRIARKREGDGGTPIGRWQMRQVFYRMDRMLPPWPGARPIGPSDGWCEKVGDRNYNRPVAMPYAAAHETMRRQDHLYDVVIALSHNERPRVQGLGSAIFFHLRRPDGGPTAGCIGVSLRDMKVILAHVARKAWFVVAP